MIVERGILDSDKSLLSKYIAGDPYHIGDPVEFWYEPGTLCNVYSDSIGPVFFMRGRPLIVDGNKVIELDIQFGDASQRRTAVALITVDRMFAPRAKKAGFSELIFNSSSPTLMAFCTRALGFTQIEVGVLRKTL